MPTNKTTLKTDSNTLHIALATYPQGGDPSEYIEGIDRYFENLGENEKKYYSHEDTKGKDSDVFYKPLKYHIFGHYDIAFITLMGNYKFAQSLFTPNTNNDEGSPDATFGPNTFQIITGLVPIINTNKESSDKDSPLKKIYDEYNEEIKEGTSDKDFSLKAFYDEYNAEIDKKGKKRNYIGICNLKLSNGFLIGNGLFFFEPVIKLVNKTIREEFGCGDNNCKNCKIQPKGVHCDKICFQYIFFQSFSWFEISLLIFNDNLDIIVDIIAKLRTLRVIDLDEDESVIDKIVANSMYRINTEWSNEEIKHSHIFADTHSYFGVRYEYFGGPIKDLGSETLTTKIEWLVKPGHLSHLIKQLNEDTKDSEANFNTENPIFITGKSDYIIDEPEDNNIKNNKWLFDMLHRKGENQNYFKHIKKIKTRLLFKSKKEADYKNENEGITDFSKYLQKLIIKTEDITKIQEQLKALKVSRQISEKVYKIFFNFNSGIQDTILFTYFVDFIPFVHRLKKLIEREYEIHHSTFSLGEKVDNGSKPVFEIEEVLKQYIDAFSEGFHLRVLNSYQFEEIYDFDLDFNSSIQQLLTTYNTIVNEAANFYYSVDESSEYNTNYIVQLNLTNTVSNEIAINYNIYHLTYPGFVFFTIDKEINNTIHYSKKYEEFVPKIMEELKKLAKSIAEDDDNMLDYIDRKIFDEAYHFNDMLRLMHTCNFDIKLFEYWFWQFNFQNSSLYNSIGIMEEVFFERELFRLLFLAYVFNGNIDDIKCPIPELYSYWHRHFEKIKTTILKFNAESVGNINIRVKQLYKMDMIENNPLLMREMNDNDATSVYEAIGIKKREFIDFERKAAKSDIPLFDTEHDKAMYIYSLMHAYLKRDYEEHKGKIYFLRRNWKDGKPIKDFLSDEKASYFIDQQGGLFFANRKKADSFFKNRNEIFQLLWHYAMVVKKDIIKHYIKPLTNNEKEN